MAAEEFCEALSRFFRSQLLDKSTVIKWRRTCKIRCRDWRPDYTREMMLISQLSSGSFTLLKASDIIRRLNYGGLNRGFF